jgi:hypothetical protein
MTEKLKPCPFCGGKAIMEIVPPHKHDKIRELVLDFFDDWTTNPCRMCGKTHYDGDDKCVNCHIGKKVKAIREALE